MKKIRKLQDEQHHMHFRSEWKTDEKLLVCRDGVCLCLLWFDPSRAAGLKEEGPDSQTRPEHECRSQKPQESSCNALTQHKQNTLFITQLHNPVSSDHSLGQLKWVKIRLWKWQHTTTVLIQNPVLKFTSVSITHDTFHVCDWMVAYIFWFFFLNIHTICV